MKIYRRLLKYTFHYKYRLHLGIFLSFLVSILNGASLTSMIPIFDSMGSSQNYKFQIAMTKRDKAVIAKYEINKTLDGLDYIEYKLANVKIKLNRFFEKKNASDVVMLFIGAVFPIYLLKLLFLTASIYLINSSGYNAIRDLRLEVYQKVQMLPLNYFTEEKTGTLMSRIINDVESLAKILSSDLKDAITDFFYVVTHLILLLLISWKMFVLVFFIMPLIMGPITAFANKIRRTTKKQQEGLSFLNGHLQEVIAGIRVIRAFSQEKKEADRFFEINDELANRTFKGHFYHQIGPSIIELSGTIISILFFIYGAYLISQEGFSRGMFIAFFLTLIFLMRPLKQLGVMFNLVQSAVSAGESVFEIIDAPIDIASPKKVVLIQPLRDKISFNQVNYTYPHSSKSILKNINLDIHCGETIALVGKSGAGKSTFVDMIPRLIDPTEGEILFDGINIKNFSLKELRMKIGVVNQNVFLFNGTIRDNLIYGRSEFTLDQIYEALNMANAMEFIDQLPKGIDTEVGERGLMLSGGQRQRIAIARALILNPEILILDEATSALDTESERQVQIALEKIYKDRTTIIIAHRLSTILIANKVYFMENGEILESGTHSELLSLNGKYKSMYETQFGKIK